MSVTIHPAAARSNIAPAAGALLAGILLLGLLFLPEGRAAVGVWLASTAYGHCFLVLPMTLFLVWDRRDSLRGMQAQPTLRYLPLALPILLAWFAAERLGIMEGRQIAALAAVELLLLSVLGRALFWALSGPLLFLFFMVPFGAFVTPLLQDFTAGFIRVGLQVLGIPAYVTDLTIEIAAGTFYVAEACAGLRFLIAAVAFGVFYALLNYRSPRRRAAFIAASIVVPVIANGIRALGIVVLGHVLGSAEAAAADHVIYGWGFFSAIMLLLVAGGMPWREPPAAADAVRPFTHPAGSPLWPALAVPLLFAAGPAAAALLQGHWQAHLAAVPALVPPPGCSPGSTPPASGGEAVLVMQCGDQALTVKVTALPYRAAPDLLSRERTRLTAAPDAEDVLVRPLATAEPANGRWSVAESRQPDRLVGVAAWVGGAPAAGGLAGRLQQARDSVLGAPYVPVLITVTPGASGHLSAQERQRALDLIRNFVDAQHALTDAVAVVSRVAVPG